MWATNRNILYRATCVDLRTFLLSPKAFCLFPCPDYKYLKGGGYVSHLTPQQLVPYLAYLAHSLFA